MAALSKDRTIKELAQEAPNGAIYNALTSGRNPERLASRKISCLGDLLTPEGETAFYSLAGTGKASAAVLHSFLYEKGFTPDWPYTEARRMDPASRLSRSLNLSQALEEADQHYATQTGEPVGEFSRKIRENTQAQKDGARLKGRRTLHGHAYDEGFRVTESHENIEVPNRTLPPKPGTFELQPSELKVENWLKLEEAAEKLHIALDTMRRYVRQGKVPHTKVGKRYLIPGSGIEDFLQKGLITGPREVKHREKPQGEHTEREQHRETGRGRKGQGGKKRGED